jgi:DNA-binding PadR family transcriptional regulator
MLTFRPMSVYAMRQAIEGSVGHFWAESYGQLYPTLRRLAADGLVTAQLSPGARGREATVYQITPRGRAELAAWVARPAVPDQVRSELLVKLFFGSAVAPEVVARNLDAAAATFRGELAALEQISAQWGRHMARDERGPFAWLTLDYGLRAMRLAVKWLEGARRTVLSRGASRPAARPAPKTRSARGAR